MASPFEILPEEYRTPLCCYIIENWTQVSMMSYEANLRDPTAICMTYKIDTKQVDALNLLKQPRLVELLRGAPPEDHLHAVLEKMKQLDKDKEVLIVILIHNPETPNESDLFSLLIRDSILALTGKDGEQFQEELASPKECYEFFSGRSRQEHQSGANN